MTSHTNSVIFQQSASTPDATFKISRPPRGLATGATSTAPAASPAPTPNGSALPVARKVTPLDQAPLTNTDSVSTSVAASAAAIPLATEPDYQDHSATQEQFKQVRFDEASKPEVKPHFPASMLTGIPSTSHCGVSKRGRYVSPGRRAFTTMPDISQSANTLLTAAAVAAAKENEGKSSQGAAEDSKDPSTKEVLMSPKSTDAKSFVPTTPTDFTVDFGSTPSKSGAFDTSNVLAWLSSPGFFSPGFSSPNTKSNCSKPPTPIVSTSFFFSDVANLPKGGDNTSNIICISPLAASKMSQGESWKEVFTSPSTRIPPKSDQQKPSPKGMDAVLAEKDVREDEDLSVLLKLASNSTPRSTRKHPDAASVPPVLPTMQESGKVRLSQKKEQRPDSFKPPSLGMRTNAKRGADQAFPFQPSSDYYGSMRVSIGGGKGPPSPRQQEPYPYQMYAAYYQQPNAPYNYPPGFQNHPPVSEPSPAQQRRPKKKGKHADKGDDGSVSVSSTGKPSAAAAAATPSTTKTGRKRSPSKRKNKSPQIGGERERVKAAATIQSLNGGRNDKAAALAAAILRGVTQRPSGKWQAQLYFAGKSRYIGVFDSREKAALAYEIAREKLKEGAATAESTEDLVNEARKAAFDGVNEQLSCK